MTTLPDWGDSGRGTLDGASADAAAEGPEAAATLEGLRVSFALGPSLLRQQQAAASATVPTANELLLGTDLTDARIPERLKARWTKTQGVPRALPKCCGPQRGKLHHGRRATAGAVWCCAMDPPCRSSSVWSRLSWAQ